MTSFHSAVNFGRLGDGLDGPDEPDLYFMMDWDRMKESVCRTPLDFMFTDIITI